MLNLCFAQKRNMMEKYFYTLFVIIIVLIILPLVRKKYHLFCSSVWKMKHQSCVCDLMVIWEKPAHVISYSLE